MREEGARKLSDIILRRMHIGMTASRGRSQIERIAGIASAELGWNEDEKQHYVTEFKKELAKETACLDSRAGRS